MEQNNTAESKDEKKSNEPIPLTKEELDALSHYATGILTERQYFESLS